MPHANATRSENEVTVTETPACCIVKATRSSIGSLMLALLMRSQVVTITKASSTPTAERGNEIVNEWRNGQTYEGSRKK